jgi:adenylosuccinate lyase
MPDRFENYVSPFSWRYGSPEMRGIWSEAHRRRIWRLLWIALVEVQAHFNLVTEEQVQDLRAHQDDIDLERALEIEAEIHHDLMAEIKTFAEQCPVGAGVIHLGATSMDIKDNSDAIRIRQALELVYVKLTSVLKTFCELMDKYADVPIMAFTNLQPAEPSTLGYRLSQYAQDLWEDWERIKHFKKEYKGKGFKGAVGTSASYAELIGLRNLVEFETLLSKRLNLPFYKVTTQIYSRKQEYLLACALAGIGATVYKFAFDLRILQSPSFGELSEPFASKQVGSSAMPFKRNPVNAEKIDSLARSLAQYPRLAWDNAAHTLLEITLDESANRRTMLPEMFLIADELLDTLEGILAGMHVNTHNIQRNLDKYAPFAATERVLMEAAKAGADRQELHAVLRQLALKAWDALEAGEDNPLEELIAGDPRILAYIDARQVRQCMDVRQHTGLASNLASDLAGEIRHSLLD